MSMDDPEFPEAGPTPAVPEATEPRWALPAAPSADARPDAGPFRAAPAPLPHTDSDAARGEDATGWLSGAAGLEAVARITHAVIRHASLQSVLDGIVAGVREELRSDTATLLLLERDVLRVRAASGLKPEDAAAVKVAVGEGFAGTIAATRRPLALPHVTPDQVISRYLRESIHALLGVPLIADGELVGVLHAGWRVERVPSDEERAFLELVGAPAAAAIVRARLYEAERASRATAEVATARLAATARASATLERVSTLLSTSLDLQRTFEHITHVLVPDIAELCQIYLADGDQIRRVALACTRKDRRDLLDALYARPALGARGRSLQATVIASGQACLVERADDKFFENVADDAEHLGLLRALAARSVIVVPLRARTAVIGAIAVGRFDEGRPFTDDDLTLVVEIGRRSGLAVENARLYGELAELSEAKSQFLSTMSHELRTPLNAIIGYASLLRDRVAGPLTELQREHVGRILGASDHLLQLINEVLTLSRLEAGRETIEPSTFDLRGIVASVAEMVSPIAARKGLQIDVAAGRPAPVRSDETKVRQILLNLMSNAIKFTDSGAVTVRVDIAREARISVRDTGRGIAPADRERIFEPFVQVSQGTTRSEGGSGLGLTVSRRLARLLGGELEVQSEVGAGSTFTLRLPLT
jgi:signal transduction histidine kinase